MRILAILILLSGPISAFGAANGEIMCAQFKNFEFVKIMNSEGDQTFPDLACVDFERFDSLAGEVFHLSPLPITDVDVIATKTVPQKAGVDFTFDHLSIGFDKRRADLIPAVSVISTHELGHNIFTEYLYQNLPVLSELNNLRIQDRGSAKLIVKFISLVEKNGECRSQACKAFAEKYGRDLERSQEISDKMNGWHRRNKDLSDKLNIIMAPYHELVADIVAVLFTKDPNATRSAIHTVLHEDETCRGFDFDSEEVVEGHGPHCVFSGVRKRILTNILEPAIANGTEKNALERIMNVLTLEIRDQLEIARQAKSWQFDQQAALSRLRKLF